MPKMAFLLTFWNNAPSLPIIMFFPLVSLPLAPQWNQHFPALVAMASLYTHGYHLSPNAFLDKLNFPLGQERDIYLSLSLDLIKGLVHSRSQQLSINKSANKVRTSFIQISLPYFVMISKSLSSITPYFQDHRSNRSNRI